MQVCIILQQNEVRRQHRNDVQRSLQQAREARGGRASGQDHACEDLIDGLLVPSSFAAAIAGPGGHPSTARRGTTARPPRKAATPTRQYPSATLQLPRQGAAVATSMTSSSSGFARRHGGARGQLCTNVVLKRIHRHRQKLEYPTRRCSKPRAETRPVKRCFSLLFCWETGSRLAYALNL